MYKLASCIGARHRLLVNPGEDKRIEARALVSGHNSSKQFGFGVAPVEETSQSLIE